MSATYTANELPLRKNKNICNCRWMQITELFLKLVKNLINNNVRVLKTTIQNHQIIMSFGKSNTDEIKLFRSLSTT